jgi:predicted ester cyclase
VSTENNRAVTERFVQAFNAGDMDAAAACFAENACNFGRAVGREGVRRVLKDIQQTFPDVKLKTIDVVAEGDWVVERGYFGGTHRGVGELPVNGGLLVGVPPTKRQFRVNHVHMYRISDDKIVDHYGLRDDLGMMQQLGLLPSPPRRPDLPLRKEASSVA